MKKLTSLIAAGLTAASMSYAGPGLADGAAKFVGNITTRGQVRDDFGTYWNQITAENECKWSSIYSDVIWQNGNPVHTHNYKYNWSGCDAAYNWAKQNGAHFKFHALLWGSQYPDTLDRANVADTKKLITEWFDKVAERYPDLEMIDVANEAIRNANGGYHSNYKQTKIIEALGGDNNNYTFLTNAFIMARERWPKAILIYNDYNTIQYDRDRGIDLINTIRKNGAPVDAYGLQAHDLMTEGGGYNGTGGGGTCMNYNEFTSTMRHIHEKTNNFPIFISEYDVPSTSDTLQLRCYKEQMSYWMEDPVVAGITIWGYVYGTTWLNCNGTADGCSGIIKDGQDRPAMTWLKQYLASNKGVNTTGLATGVMTDPEPQTPFKGTPISIPGKIEAEDFDIPGVGYGTASYGVAESKTHGDSDYRKDTPVSIYKKATGNIIGYNNEGNWYEYTVKVEKAGTYTVYAAVAAAGSTSSFKLSLGDKDISKVISVPAAAAGEENYDDYNKVKFDVELPEGEHILRLTVVGAWFDIDYMTFVESGEADPEPIVKEPESSASADPTSSAEGESKPASSASGDEQPASSATDEGSKIPGENDKPMALTHDMSVQMNVLSKYAVFDMKGAFMGVLNAYSVEQAMETVRFSNLTKADGIYYLRDQRTGKMHSFRVVR